MSVLRALYGRAHYGAVQHKDWWRVDWFLARITNRARAGGVAGGLSIQGKTQQGLLVIYGIPPAGNEGPALSTGEKKHLPVLFTGSPFRISAAAIVATQANEYADKRKSILQASCGMKHAP